MIKQNSIGAEPELPAVGTTDNGSRLSTYGARTYLLIPVIQPRSTIYLTQCKASRVAHISEHGNGCDSLRYGSGTYPSPMQRDAIRNKLAPKLTAAGTYTYHVNVSSEWGKGEAGVLTELELVS